jgi:glycerol-3-phosphate dehydrogenase
MAKEPVSSKCLEYEIRFLGTRERMLCRWARVAFLQEEKRGIMKNRAEALRSVASQSFDVCVIGGGATGAGCALDAQLRGLRTVLVEGGDFASGTSGNCSKMVHGGVRYLQQAVLDRDIRQYEFVKSALHERKIMLNNAPHLAHPTVFLVPCFSRLDVYYYRIGMKLYDWIAGSSKLIATRFYSRDEAVARAPMLKADGLLGAVAYADGAFDDSRYGITLVQTFAGLGGAALNYARVTGFAYDSSGKIEQAHLEDRISGVKFSLSAKAFVNATGPFSDQLRALATPGANPRLRLSRGVHLVLPIEILGGKDALLIPKTEDGRIVYAVPWRGRLAVGTTDDETTMEDPLVVRREEAEYLLRYLNGYLSRPVKMEQVVSAFAGVRPLVSVVDALQTKKIARSHEVETDPASGLISILGGKWTTYRAMAEDTIDAVQQQLGMHVTPCNTMNHRLAGAETFNENASSALGATYGVSCDTAGHLIEKFGSFAAQILDLSRLEPELQQPLVPELAPIMAEVIYSIRCEMAATLEDILVRRTGLQLYSWRAALQAAPAVSRLLARELGWMPEREQRELSEYQDKVKRQIQELGLSL